MTRPIKKLDLKDLKIYLYTVQAGRVNVVVPEDFKAILAHNDNDAMKIVQSDYSRGRNIFINKRAEIDVQSKILDAICIDTPSVDTVKRKRATTKKEFINGLMLVADKYMESS